MYVKDSGNKILLAFGLCARLDWWSQDDVADETEVPDASGLVRVHAGLILRSLACQLAQAHLIVVLRAAPYNTTALYLIILSQNYLPYNNFTIKLLFGDQSNPLWTLLPVRFVWTCKTIEKSVTSADFSEKINKKIYQTNNKTWIIAKCKVFMEPRSQQPQS